VLEDPLDNCRSEDGRDDLEPETAVRLVKKLQSSGKEAAGR